MATVTTLPGVVSESSIKPTRSMTHPLRYPKANGGGGKVKKGESFDPEDLTRRLTAHLIEQKLKAERRREARALRAAALALQNAYHHVPAVAASAFERTTTTSDATRQAHVLSKPIVNAHLKRPSLDAHFQGIALTSLQRTQAMDQAMLEQESLRNRNQFQWDHELEEANYADTERDLYRMPQRTFNSGFAQLNGTHSKSDPRPLSTGDAFWQEDIPRVPTKSKVPQNDGHDRHDWAQREEEVETRKKERISPFLRKMESTWILMGRKEKMSMKQVTESSDSSPEGERQRRGNFLALFRRQSS